MSEKLVKKYEGEEVIVVENEEQLMKYVGKKLKKSWINSRDKLCTSTFILLGKKDNDKDSYVYVKVIQGKADKSPEAKLTAPIKDLFVVNSLVYLSYISPEDLRQKLSLKAQNINF